MGWRRRWSMEINFTAKLSLSDHLFNSRCYFFVCVEFIVPLENFILIWRRHHCRWRAANFDLCSALMAIEQWGFFNVPYLLWHGPTVYNGHLRGPMSLKPVAERLAVKLSLPVCTTQVCRDRGSNPDLPHARRTLYLYATAAVQMVRESSGHRTMTMDVRPANSWKCQNIIITHHR